MTRNYSNIRSLLSRYRFVLASGSPRRVSLLQENAIPFRQLIPDIDENNHLAEDPVRYAERLAFLKTEAVLPLTTPNEIIIGCDTIVILEGKILGKPSSPDHAFQMLRALSGKKHTVCSAVSLQSHRHAAVIGSELSDVFFKEVSDEAIKAYIRTGEPLDKAGAYGIQNAGGFLVDRVEGNIDNVIGLPMTLLDYLAGKIYSELKAK